MNATHGESDSSNSNKFYFSCQRTYQSESTQSLLIRISISKIRPLIRARATCVDRRQWQLDVVRVAEVRIVGILAIITAHPSSELCIVNAWTNVVSEETSAEACHDISTTQDERSYSSPALQVRVSVRIIRSWGDVEVRNLSNRISG